MPKAMNGIKFIKSISTAVTLATMVWVSWALATPGDYFANGNEWVNPSLVLAVLVGSIVGWWAANKIMTTIIFIGALAAVGYWVFVPSGWWAYGP